MERVFPQTRSGFALRVASLHAALLFSTSLLSACLELTAPGSGVDQEVESRQPRGVVQITLLPQQAFPSHVTGLTIAIEPSGTLDTVVFDTFANEFTTSIISDTGLQTVTVRAWNSNGVVIGEGSGAVIVTANQTAALRIHILDTTGRDDPTPPVGPLIVAASASTLGPTIGQTVTFVVDAADPDSPTLDYLWSDDCVGSTFSAPDATSTLWSANQAQACTVTIDVSDGLVTESESFQITVFDGELNEGSVLAFGSYVPHPRAIIFELRYSGVDYSFTKSAESNMLDVTVAPGEQLLNLTFFYDLEVLEPDFQELRWFDDCGGSWSFDSKVPSSVTAFLSGPTWTAPAVPADCVLTGVVHSFGLEDEIRVGVIVR